MPSALLQHHLPRAWHRARTYRRLHAQLDVAYADRDGCRLDVLRPEGSGTLPVVLHVHGGAFRVLSKDTHGAVAARYARAGFLVLNVDYRLAPAHPFPAAVQDVHEAWVWACDHVAALGGDPDRIVLAGESAGANLVLGLAMSFVTERLEPWAQAVRATRHRPVGLQPICGFLQASDTARYGREVPVSPLVRRRLPVIEGDYLGAVPTSADLTYANPLGWLEQLDNHPALPHVLALCGDADPIAHDTRRLISALEGHDVPHTARWIPGGRHALHMLPGRPAREAWQELIRHARRCVSAG